MCCNIVVVALLNIFLQKLLYFCITHIRHLKSVWSDPVTEKKEKERCRNDMDIVRMILF